MSVVNREIVDRAVIEGMAAKANEWGKIENVHPVEVEVNTDGSITTVDHEGTRMKAGESAHRGVRIQIRFRSEHGDQFALVFQFHKGDAQVAMLNDPDPPSWNTIWRD